MRIINLTPHTARLLHADGSVMFEWAAPRQRAARVRYVTEASSVAGLSVTRKRVVDVQGLPAPSPGIGYLVSRQVAHAVKGERDDVFFMDELSTAGVHVHGGRTLAQFSSEASSGHGARSGGAVQPTVVDAGTQ